MTETVEFRLEKSFPELQDLVHKELFTQDEVRTILKKRTQHEHTILCRTAQKADFLRYIQYEINLESLRKKRLKRLQKSGKRSISDYAGPKRIRTIFQRATARFQDLELWIQYIEYSKSQGSLKMTGKLFGEALQKFPHSAELWILAARYEYDTNLNISGTRNLLLQAIRVNPEKRELWWEYTKLECRYVLKILERRRILGLNEQKEEDMVETDISLDQDEITLPTITEEDFKKHDGPRLDPLLTSPLTDASTNPALNGAIPMTIYSSAIATRSNDLSLVVGFYDVFLQFYPALSFVDAALDTVKQHLADNFPGRGKTLLVQIKDHARGLRPTDQRYPAAIRGMLKTAVDIPTLPAKDRKECCEGLLQYLDMVSHEDGLDENLQKAAEIFQGKVRGWLSEER